MDFQKIHDFVYAQRSIGEHSVHGPEHWAQVEFNGLFLAGLNGADSDVVRLFALFHDSRRINDGHDQMHGPHGAELARKVRNELLPIDDEKFAMLYLACTAHTVASRTSVVTVDTCFDADRLDLVRIGIMPDPARMATPEGAAIARLAQREGISANEFRAWIRALDPKKIIVE